MSSIEWGPFCSVKGMEHEAMDILVGRYCPQCGAQNPGQRGTPIQINIDDVPEPSKQAMIVPTSQLQSTMAKNQLPPTASAAQRAQYKNEAVLQRTQSIDGRSSSYQRQQPTTTGSRAGVGSKTPSIASKIAFDVSYYHLVWYGNTVVEANNAYGMYIS